MKKTVALAFVFLSNLLFLSGCIAKTYSCTIYENTNYVRIIDASSAKLNEVRINQNNYKILYDETRLNEFTNQRIDRYCGFVNDVLQNQKTSPRLIKALM